MGLVAEPPLRIVQAVPSAEALRYAASIEAARLSFVGFLRFVMIEEVIIRPGMDPEAAGAIPMELWPHLLERARAWNRGEDEVILKARQLGLSWLAAAFACWKGLQPASRVLMLSKGELEAFELLRKVEFIHEHLPVELQKPLEVDNKGELSFEDGGAIRALPSTKDAGRGWTARLVIADEAAFHQWAQENFKAYRATVADGGQLIILSTANGVGGFFYDRYWAAVRYADLRDQIARGVAGEGFDSHEVIEALNSAPRPVFIPWFARPDRDSFWLAREKLQYPGLPDEFRQEYPETAADAFVQLTGLVFPQFAPERHVASEPCAWKECLYRYYSYDLGGGDPTAIGVYGIYRTKEGTEKVHQFGSFYKRMGAPTVDEMVGFLLPWHRNAPFTNGEPDPIDATVAETLRSHGLPLEQSHHYGLNESLGVHALYLDNDWLTIGEHCKDDIAEFHGFRWATRVDPNSKDRYKIGTPHDHHGDGIAARRLALTLIYYDMQAHAAVTGKDAMPAMRVRT